MRRKILHLSILMALSAILGAGCSSGDKISHHTPLVEPEDLTPVRPRAINPYTTVTHSLHGPVRSVVTVVYDRSVLTGDDCMISSDCKTYDSFGQLISETITAEGYSGDTLRIDYGSDGRMKSGEDSSVEVVYDDKGRLVRVETYAMLSDGSNGDMLPEIVTLFSYDAQGRLVSEAMATGRAVATGGEWMSIDEYEYGPDGLARAYRDDCRGSQSVMELDSTGAPMSEDLYDNDGHRLRHSDYVIGSRDRHGNWTDASVTTNHRKGPSVHRHILRTIGYYQ